MLQLLEAIDTEDDKKVESLLDVGCPVQWMVNRDTSLFEYACRKGNLTIIILLLRTGKIKFRGDTGFTLGLMPISKL